MDSESTTVLGLSRAVCRISLNQWESKHFKYIGIGQIKPLFIKFYNFRLSSQFSKSISDTWKSKKPTIDFTISG